MTSISSAPYIDLKQQDSGFWEEEAPISSTANTEPQYPSKPNAEEYIIQFSHFSVKEYLGSTRIAIGPVSRFRIDRTLAEKEVLQGCFAYLIHTGSLEPTINNELHVKFPLLHYMANCWSYHMQ